MKVCKGQRSKYWKRQTRIQIDEDIGKDTWGMATYAPDSITAKCGSGFQSQTKRRRGKLSSAPIPGEISTRVLPEKGITHAEQRLGTQQSIAAKNVSEMDSRTADPLGRPCSLDNEHLPLGVAGKAFPPSQGHRSPKRRCRFLAQGLRRSQQEWSQQIPKTAAFRFQKWTYS